MEEKTKKTAAEKEADEKADGYEIYTTILIGLATVLGALSAYYAALWAGESQTNYTLAIQEQGRANTAYLEVLNDYTEWEMDGFKDDILYSEWKNNLERNDPDAEYFFSQLSEGLQKDLKDNPNDDMANYNKEQEAREKELEERFDDTDAQSDSAKIILQKGQDANGYGDKFTFATVLLTIVLFFGGLSALKSKKQLKKIYLSIATIVLILSIIRIFTVPFPG